MSLNRWAAAGAWVCLAGLLQSSPAMGDERKLVASLGVKEEYNDNLFFSSGRKIDTFLTSATPALELTSRTERLDAGLFAGAEGLAYTADEGLDAVDQNYRGRLGYRFTPAFRLSGEAGFRKDTRPDREIEATGLFVTFRSERWSGSAAAEYAVTEKTLLAASYGFEKADYDAESRIDYKVHSAGLTLIHDLGRHLTETKGRVLFGFTRSEFTGIRIDNYTLAVGAARGVTEKWSVQADAGARFTRSEFDVERLEFVPPFFFVIVTSREKRDNWGWIASVAMNYRGEKNRGSLSYNRDVSAASGREGATERNALAVDLGHRFTYEFSGSLTAAYYTNKSDAGDFSLQTIDEKTVRVRPAIRYDFTKDVFGEAACQYTKVLYGQTDTDAAQNVVYLRVGMKHLLYE